MSERKEGWGKSPVSRKWHYFRNGMSLCCKVGFYLGPLEQNDDDDHPDKCAQCKRLLMKENEKGN